MRMIEKIKNFASELKTELRHVNWPTRREVIRLTAVVIGLSLGLAVFLGGFDYLFSDLLKFIVVK